MSNYRRAAAKGASYFFTLVSYQRRNIFCDQSIRFALRQAIKRVQNKSPFSIDAWVLLPNHMHCIWTLPEGDNNFSQRWSSIKRRVSIECGQQYKQQQLLTESKVKRRESTLWQRRFWEHQIRNQQDFNNHLDYIHYNPVKHNYCYSPSQWQYSTIHRYIKEGYYPYNWGEQEPYFSDINFGE